MLDDCSRAFRSAARGALRRKAATQIAEGADEGTVACAALAANITRPLAHGKCQASPKDSCLCFTRRETELDVSSDVPAWTGADCSEREFGEVLSWPLPPAAVVCWCAC